ncbi:MAG TPA: AAA family ATPase [Candidatus Paceibacterota bacterium]|nr:AAA family ATPase [Candidatus Paceibacterota bacterium]
MIFKKVTIQNFFSFGPNAEELDLSKPGLYLINGLNGEGKSAVFDAITFALFGQVTKKVTLPEIVNEKIGQDCKVTLEFQLGKDVYYIERYRKHKKHYDNAYFYKNGKDKEHLISKANKTDTQELIENIIKFNYKSFVNAVMMSQESVSSFIDSDPAKKKEIIENILQINIMTKYHWIAQRKRQQLGKDIELLDRETGQMENNVNSLKQSMVEYVKSCKRQKTESLEKIEKFTQQLKEIENTNIDQELEKIELAHKLAKEIEQKQILEQSIRDKIKIIKREYESVESNKIEYNSFIETNQNLINKNNDEIKKTQKNYELLSLQIEEVKANPERCPLCKNEINEHDHKIWVNEKQEELITLQESINEKEKQHQSLLSKIQEWQEKIQEVDITLKNIQSKIDQEEKQAKQLKQEIESTEIPKTKDEQELKELGNKKLELELKIQELQNKQFVDLQYLESLEGQARNVENEFKNNKKQLKEKQKKYLIMEWWEQSLSSKKKSMKSWCINNIIGYFNARIKFYMDRFFDGQIQIQMDTELNETIIRKDKNRTYGQFSAGQKRRLNLSILFALNSLVKANISTKISIMFLDEILSNYLDDKGVSTVLELLEDMKENGETAFIIEHKDSFKEYPSFKPIRVYLDNNEFSHIKVS